MMKPGLGYYLECQSKAWEDLRHRIDGFNERNVQMACWMQSWSSTACGFGGLGGATTTLAPTVVLRYGSAYYVYHNGKYAYLVRKPTEEFMSSYKNKNLPGKAKYDENPEQWGEKS